MMMMMMNDMFEFVRVYVNYIYLAKDTDASMPVDVCVRVFVRCSSAQLEIHCRLFSFLSCNYF